MFIRSLEVQNLRCHDYYKIKTITQKTAIIGRNGSGKTSLLEAIYLLAQGKSFRDSDQDLVKTKQTWFRVDATVATTTMDYQRTVKCKVDQNIKDKTIIINQKIHKRLPLTAKIPIVLFEPDDLNLISGSPNRRRKYLDQLIAQLNPLHSRLLSRYARTLKQRNELITKALANSGVVNAEKLFSWNILLSQYGGQIIKNRLEAVQYLNQYINQIYQQITHQTDQLELKYHFEVDQIKQLEQRIFNQLERQTNFNLGTQIGPHRHDLEIYFNQKLANKCSSRGETRSIILALKLIELQLIKDRTGFNPIVLLDDVLSELDQQRQQFLMQYTNDSQIFLTSINADDFSNYQVIQLT